MKTITQKKLDKILEEHELWLETTGSEGKKADLSETDLCSANLRDANLYCADLQYADLRDADLRDADLRDANLYCADLRDADLRDADLCDADLRGTNITVIKGSIHTVINTGDDRISIGCKQFSIQYWLENYEQIGKESNYTEEQINEYKDYIDLITKRKGLK